MASVVQSSWDKRTHYLDFPALFMVSFHVPTIWRVGQVTIYARPKLLRLKKIMENPKANMKQF